MEKISRILPPSPRTQAAEVAQSQPGRPGAPAFGRPPQREASIQDKVSFSATERAAEQIPGLYRNTRENARAKIVDDLAKRFFESTPKDLARDSGLSRSEEIAQDLQENPAYQASDL